MADRVLAVSDFVARRKVQVDLVPEERVRRLWNSLSLPALDPRAGEALRSALPIDGEGPVVLCACRATPEKGVHHLLEAFDAVVRAWGTDEVPPTLVYLGDGPQMSELRELRDRLPSGDRVILAGYRDDAAALVAGADLCVVPSVWAEAFGLAALEPMASGVPVIASRTGGIPEVVEDGVTGLLVEPGDEEALARALRRLLDDPGERGRMGANGRLRVRTHFSIDGEIDALAGILGEGLISLVPPSESMLSTREERGSHQIARV
jgi:glycosyltransferase involved in cell wall biosynthesis